MIHNVLDTRIIIMVATTSVHHVMSHNNGGHLSWLHDQYTGHVAM